MERRTLVAFASALVEDGLPAVSPRVHEHMLAECEKTVNALPRIARTAFHYLIPVIEYLPVLLGCFRTFSLLPRRERARILKSWGRSSINRLRMPFLGLKALLAMGIASAPDVEEAVGYRKECQTGDRYVRHPQA